jgi:hypothetical protein
MTWQLLQVVGLLPRYVVNSVTYIPTPSTAMRAIVPTKKGSFILFPPSLSQDVVLNLTIENNIKINMFFIFVTRFTFINNTIIKG